MGINLADYVPVSERLVAAKQDIESVSNGAPVMLTPTMGYIQTVIRLKDGRYATGTASFKLDLMGKSAQATSPLEDAETSAIGRALAFLGYHSSRSIASREEVVEAQRRAEEARFVTGRAVDVTVAKNGGGKSYSRFSMNGTTYIVPGTVEEGEQVRLRPGEETFKGVKAELL